MLVVYRKRSAKRLLVLSSTEVICDTRILHSNALPWAGCDTHPHACSVSHSTNFLLTVLSCGSMHPEHQIYYSDLLRPYNQGQLCIRLGLMWSETMKLMAARVDILGLRKSCWQGNCVFG